jgi:hypothetical protein
MSRSRSIRLAAATALALGACATAATSAEAAPNILGNPSFEAPLLPANSFHVFPASSFIGAWQVGSTGNVDVINGALLEAAKGKQSIDLSGTTYGGVCQTVVLAAGQAYKLSLSLAGNPFSGGSFGPAIKRLGITLAHNTTVDVSGLYTFDVTGHTQADPGWKKVKIVFRALVTDNYQLCLRSGTVGTAGPVVDNVVLKVA